MGMNLGSGSGSGEPEIMMDINTTPLIDVMLVLIIMLIITIPVQLHTVNLNMPAGNPPPPLAEPVVVTIDVDFDGTILWNGEALPSREALQSKLAQAAALPDQPEVHIRGDEKTRFESIGRVIFACTRAAIQKISFVTEPPAKG